MEEKHEIIEASFKPKSSDLENLNQIVAQFRGNNGSELTIYKGANHNLAVALAKVMIDHAH